MKVEYVNNVKTWIEKNKWNKCGISEFEIEALEVKIKRKLPKAFKEFLVLTGKAFQPWAEWAGLMDLLESEINETTPNLLKRYGVTLPKDNYWVICDENGAMFFFYFDEGDNPPIYICEYELKGFREDYLRVAAKTFSDFIQDRIYYYELR